jgi:hypothetical protein
MVTNPLRQRALRTLYNRNTTEGLFSGSNPLRASCAHMQGFHTSESGGFHGHRFQFWIQETRARAKMNVKDAITRATPNHARTLSIIPSPRFGRGGNGTKDVASSPPTMVSRPGVLTDSRQPPVAEREDRSRKTSHLSLSITLAAARSIPAVSGSSSRWS